MGILQDSSPLCGDGGRNKMKIKQELQDLQLITELGQLGVLFDPLELRVGSALHDGQQLGGGGGGRAAGGRLQLRRAPRHQTAGHHPGVAQEHRPALLRCLSL